MNYLHLRSRVPKSLPKDVLSHAGTDDFGFAVSATPPRMPDPWSTKVHSSTNVSLSTETLLVPGHTVCRR